MKEKKNGILSFAVILEWQISTWWWSVIFHMVQGTLTHAMHRKHTYIWHYTLAGTNSWIWYTFHGFISTEVTKQTKTGIKRIFWWNQENYSESNGKWKKGFCVDYWLCSNHYLCILCYMHAIEYRLCYVVIGHSNQQRRITQKGLEWENSDACNICTHGFFFSNLNNIHLVL